MYTYNYRLDDRYNRPVASLAILADDRPSWKPTSYQATTLGTKMQFDFSIAKLLDFSQAWDALETNSNPFSTVVMAHLKARDTNSG